jgi:hypothetical protein
LHADENPNRPATWHSIKASEAAPFILIHCYRHRKQAEMRRR